MIDPVEALIMGTKSLLVPTSTASATPTGFPTVIPDPPVFEEARTDGHRALWVVFVVMALSSATFTGLSWNVPLSKRLFHVVTTLITIIAAISYFGMATGTGVSYNHIRVRESNNHGIPDTFKDVYREVYWARYVDWALTTPLLLLDLSLLAGLSGGHILIAVVADIIMILTGLFAAFGAESNGSKWGWYSIACVAYLVIIWHLATHGRAQASTKGKRVATLYGSIAGFTVLIWTAYPVIWGIADGARILSVDAEILAYTVLDILAKPVFGFWLLLAHRNMPETAVDIGGFWSHGLGAQGQIRIADDDEEGA